MQSWIATCTFPHKDCVVQSSIETTVPSPCFGKWCARSSLLKRKIRLDHDQSQNLLSCQSLLFLCSPKVLYQVCCYQKEMVGNKKDAKDIDCRRCVKAWLSWNMTGHISAPVSLEWFPPSFQHILKRIDLGKMMIDLVFLSIALVGPRVLVSTEWGWWMKTHVQRDVEVEVSKEG